nr:hypothetical protein [Klugiella xanthotipulae]
MWGGNLPQRSCSRAGCTAEATWRIDWRNPRIHRTDRLKTWLACAEHVDYLSGFLTSRSFPVTITALDVVVSSTGDHSRNPLPSGDSQ